MINILYSISYNKLILYNQFFNMISKCHVKKLIYIEHRQILIKKEEKYYIYIYNGNW